MENLAERAECHPVQGSTVDENLRIVAGKTAGHQEVGGLCVPEKINCDHIVSRTVIWHSVLLGDTASVIPVNNCSTIRWRWGESKRGVLVTS